MTDNVNNSECELEFGALTPNTTNAIGATGVAIDTTINFANTGVGLGVNNVIGLGAALTTATIVTNENIFNVCALSSNSIATNTNGVTLGAPDATVYFNNINCVLCEFNNIEWIFNAIFNENEFENEINSEMIVGI